MGCLSLFIGSCYGNNVEVLSLTKRLMCKGTWDISYVLCLDFITSTSILSPDKTICDLSQNGLSMNGLNESL